MRDTTEPLPAPATRPEVPAEVAAAGYRAAADAPETLRADLAGFRAWCAQEGRPAAIPAVVPEAVAPTSPRLSPPSPAAAAPPRAPPSAARLGRPARPPAPGAP